jgi:hypothetical protein
MNAVQQFEIHRKVCPQCMDADWKPLGEMQRARCHEGQQLSDAAIALCFRPRLQPKGEHCGEEES